MLKTIIFLPFLLITQYSIGQHTILWKVSDTTTGKHSILVGTFHQFGNSFVDAIPEIKKALLESDMAIFESIDDRNIAINLINARVSSKDMEKELKKSDVEKLQQLSENWKVDIYKLTPREISWKLQQEFQKVRCGTVLPTDEWDHFDNYLIHLATVNNIRLHGLETSENQLEFIEQEQSSNNWKSTQKEIHFWIQKMTAKKLDSKDCQFAEKYKNFNLDYQFSKECPLEVLLQQRNAEWMKALPTLLSTKNCFVAVGYLHLMYQCGLIEQLRAHGFVVEPILISSK